MRDESQESIIGTPQGCIKVRDIKRFALEDERWDQDRFNSFRGVPWEPVPGSGSCKINVRVRAPRLSDEVREKLISEDRPYVARRFRINREDFKEIGHTPLCPGCRCIIRGLPAQNHSELCRSRIEAELIRKGDSRISHEEVRREPEIEPREHQRGEEGREVKKRAREDEEGMEDSGKKMRQQGESYQEDRQEGLKRKDDSMGSDHEDADSRHKRTKHVKEVSFGETTEEDQDKFADVIQEWQENNHEEILEKIREKRVLMLVQGCPIEEGHEIERIVKASDKVHDRGGWYAFRFRDPDSKKVQLMSNMHGNQAKEVLSRDESGRSKILKELMRARSKGEMFTVTHDEDNREWHWDDMSGEQLNGDMVKKARQEEMKYFQEYQVYMKVPESECWRVTGKGPIGTRWVDINKGDKVNPDYRSRLVAQEVKLDKCQDLFAGTPPLEAKKILMSLATTQGIGFGSGPHLKLDFIDVSRAYFHAAARRDVYVKLPQEDQEPGMVGKLLKAMYGTRDAAQNWECEYREFMLESAGFQSCMSSPCMFWHQDRNIRCVVHGDDFTLLGSHEQLMWFREKVKEKFQVKFRGMLGPSSKDDKQVTILNRTVTWDKGGITYKADPRHVEIVVKELGLQDSKAVRTPYNHESQEDDDEELDDSQALRYRACVARLNYLAQDRSDIQYPVKELCRFMSRPTQGDWRNLIRMGKYLKGRKEMAVKYWYQGKNDVLTTWTDSDHAGCRRTRKSTSGGVILLGKHVIKSWSTTQAVIALSSGEAEYYSMVKGGSVSMGCQAMLKEIGVQVSMVLKCDASAAVGIVLRRGLGRVRHIDVSQLWLQEKVAQGVFHVIKVKSSENRSDALTKHVSRNDIDWHLKSTGQEEILEKIFKKEGTVV